MPDVVADDEDECGLPIISVSTLGPVLHSACDLPTGHEGGCSSFLLEFEDAMTRINWGTGPCPHCKDDDA